jgi:hypothetical protein
MQNYIVFTLSLPIMVTASSAEEAKSIVSEFYIVLDVKKQ